MNYREALAWLYATQTFGIKLGLDNIERLLRALDLGELIAERARTSPPSTLSRARTNEEVSARAPKLARASRAGEGPSPSLPRVLHVAGTNGKGSVCAMADSILRAAHFRTGLFTSPHLVSFRERIRVNGAMIGESETADGLTRIRVVCETLETHPTFFEIVTALALDHFRNESCDTIILETGMGGRLDATNAVQSNVCVITPIALDHQKWLGQTLAEIATEKAGIVKPNIPVFSSPQLPEAKKVLRNRAQACDAPLVFITEPWRTSPLSLLGPHQQMNASLAVAAATAIAPHLSDNAIRRGLEIVAWPARFQILRGGRIVIDGAHNPAGAKILAKTWRQTFGNERATVVLAILADKDTSAMIEELRPLAARFILPKIHSVRAVSPAELAGQINHAVAVNDLPTALAQAQKFPERILLTGSLHFAGEALAHLENRPAAYEECMQ